MSEREREREREREGRARKREEVLSYNAHMCMGISRSVLPCVKTNKTLPLTVSDIY